MICEHREELEARLRCFPVDDDARAELLQDVYVAALQTSTTFEDASSFLEWCSEVAQRTCVKWQRRRAIRAEIEPTLQLFSYTSAWSERQDPERQTTLRELVDQALQHIGERDFEMLINRYVESVTAIEIASRDAASPAAVRMRLSRSRAALRAAIK
jgi:RNA polymerase sigma factor (sigma-70 family)